MVDSPRRISAKPSFNPSQLNRIIFGLARKSIYNRPFSTLTIATLMEAEQLNLLAHTLTDLRSRNAELRRYL